MKNWIITSSRCLRGAVIVSIVLLSACTRAPQLIGIDNPEVPVASVQGATKQKVFIATTRKETETAGALFSEQRALEIGLASVQVSIPPNHLVGELERPDRLPPDPTKEFAVIDPTIYANETAFIAALNAELKKRPRGQRDILFFVHGYNNTTSDAVLRLAQFAEDTEFEGVPVLFDWASAASYSRYVYDMNSALIARPKIRDMGRLLAKTNAEGYHLFAHSMGAFLTMEAIKDVDLSKSYAAPSRLKSIILASPDIDMDLFRSQLNQIDKKFDRFFVLFSQDDSALLVSRRIAGGVPRVGAANTDELAALGVVAIDLSEVDNSSSGSHTKFAGSPEVVQLIGNGLNRGHSFDNDSTRSELNKAIKGLPITIEFN